VTLRHAAPSVFAAAALAAVWSCAHVEAPPGGIPDKEAPRIVTTRPDTFAAMRSYVGPVIFSFDEGLSEKGIDTVVTVSPRTSSVAVDKSGHEVKVELRRGWQPNRVYQVTLHPGVTDLFGNATREPVTVVFSTGVPIVHTVATGTVVDRTTLQPARGARIEAIHQPDSVLYETRPDSAGAWTLEYLPEGTYQVRAYNDTNKDQQLQPYEARDTATIQVSARDTVRSRRLALLAPDSTAPKAGNASGEGDMIEVRFDDFLDPMQPLTPAQVTVTSASGAVVPVAMVRVGPFPSVRRDSAAAADTGEVSLPGRAAPTPARPAAVTPARPTAPARPAASAAARPDTGAAARRDTTPAEPLPSQTLAIRTAQPLAPDAQYTVTVRDVRNLAGLSGGGTVPMRTPKPQPQPARTDSAAAGARDTAGVRADTSSARRDSAAARPPVTPQAPPAQSAPATSTPAAPPPAPPAPRPQSSPAPVARPERFRR
jgi:hypothetical protein